MLITWFFWTMFDPNDKIECIGCHSERSEESQPCDVWHAQVRLSM